MIQLTEQTLFADRYQFRRLLGRGGFSEVWLAVDKMTGLEIAVKVYAPGQGLDEDGMNNFCKELSQVYNLNHTNLVKPQHVDNWMGMPYLVMTYCPQGSCHRQIGTMTEEQIWKLLHDVASGLAYLHEQGIIHQDIKPDNILVDPLGNYVITDFGISVQSRSTLRKSMNLAASSGTTAYMGPERFSKDPAPVNASDIWSLGATVYELLTGNAPFGEIGGGLQKGGAEIPTIKQNISPKLRQTIARMLAAKPWDRPTAKQLVEICSPKQRNKKLLYILLCIIGALFLLIGGVAYYHYFIKLPREISKLTALYSEETDRCAKFISSMNYRDNEKKLQGPILGIAKVEELEQEKLFPKTKLVPESDALLSAYRDSLASIQNRLDREISIEKSYLEAGIETTWLKNLQTKKSAIERIAIMLENENSVQEIKEQIIPTQK